MTVDVTIERATPEDAGAILELLRANALPVDGLLDHLATALVARSLARVVGSAALEVYDDGALLRSVAVDATLRGHGVGHRLTAAALDLAGTLRVPAVYLLTVTAEGYFPRFAFRHISRDEVPRGVQQSVEFRSACPSTAIVMMKALRLSAPIPASSSVPTSGPASRS
jgi:amino-acid N-acetyltransferase